MSDKYSIIRDEFIALDLATKGYHVCDFLDEKNLQDLIDLYESFPVHKSLEDGWFTSAFENDFAYRNSVYEGIKTVYLNAGLDKFLQSYKPVYGSFIAKPSSENSQVPLHQDDSFFDEYRYSPVCFWCPLQDTNDKNGAFQIIEGSHRLFPPFRDDSIYAPYRNITPHLHSKLKSVCMKAGQVLIFDQSTIHYSAPNLSDQTRKASTLLLVDEKAEIYTFYRNPGVKNPKVEVYRQSSDYFFSNETFQQEADTRPRSGEYVGYIDYDPKLIDESTFDLYLEDILEGKREKERFEVIPKRLPYKNALGQQPAGFWERMREKIRFGSSV